MQVVAKAAAYGEAQQLSAIEAQPHAAGFAIIPVDHNRVPSSPPKGGVRIGNAAKQDMHRGHGSRP